MTGPWTRPRVGSPAPGSHLPRVAVHRPVGRAVVRRPGGGERGSGTVLAVALVGVLATLLLAGALIAAVVVTGLRARTAADLAALAAAAETVAGSSQGGACGVAGEVARRNGADLTACRTGIDAAGLPRVEVTVARTTPGDRWTVSRRAVAGGVPDRSAVQVEPAAVLGGVRP